MSQNRLWVLMALVIMFLSQVFLEPGFAQNKDLGPLIDRLQRIERDIKTLNIQVLREGGVSGESTGSSAAARAAVRLTDLEDELRAITGRVEMISQQVVDIGLRLDKLITDLDYRFGNLESIGPEAEQKVRPSPLPGSVQQELPRASQPGVLGTIKKTSIIEDKGVNPSVPSQPAGAKLTLKAMADNMLKTPSILPKGTSAERYAYAVALLRKGDYEQAERAFNEFMTSHSGDDLIDNARYWLAESYYVRGLYVKAAEYFLSGYQANAAASKAPDMLLKLGMSLSKLDKNKDACASFAKLLVEFPKASSRILKKVALESKNIGCD